jgi:hypothetical protein
LSPSPKLAPQVLRLGKVVAHARGSSEPSSSRTTINLGLLFVKHFNQILIFDSNQRCRAHMRNLDASLDLLSNYENKNKTEAMK